MRRGALLLLWASMLAGCGIAGARDRGPDESVVVWEDGNEQWVRLEPRDDAGSPANEHPAQVAAAQISGALASLQVVEDEDPAEPVFTAQEMRELGDAIARALAQASPEQDVTFRSRGSVALTGKKLKSVHYNSGRVFEQEGKLNLILGDVQRRAKTKSVYGKWDQDFSEPRSASRSASASHDWKLVVPAGVEQHAGRDDWLVFDNAQLAALSAPAPAVAPTAAAAPAAPAPAPTSATAPAAPAPAAPAVQNAPAAPAAASPEADMERRLRTLKDLHDKGLITEEAYRAKVEEILSVL
jgi:hypothetical protein